MWLNNEHSAFIKHVTQNCSFSDGIVLLLCAHFAIKTEDTANTAAGRNQKWKREKIVF